MAITTLDVVATAEPTTSSSRIAWLRSPFRLLIRTSLAFALGAGFSLGLYLILGFGFGLPLVAGTPALMQVHGQVQVFGFLVLFVMGVAVQLFPRFHASRLDRPLQVSCGGLLLALGVVLRLAAQPLPVDTGTRPTLLILSGLLQLFGALLAVHAFARVIRGGVQPAPSGWQILLPATMGGSLLLALVLNLALSFELAQGAVVVPFNRDEALLHLQLWGFASTMVLAVSGRVFPRFLLLQATRERLVRAALVCWASGTFGVSALWLVLDGAAAPRLVVSLAQLVGGALFVAGLRLYEAPLRESGMPHVTNPTRTWVRVAFAFLLVAAVANVGIAAAEVLGRATTLTQSSAARHLLAQGFLLPIIVLMAARILPGYSRHMLHRPRLLASLVWSLLVGAALRGVAELIGGYAPGWGPAVALGGTLAVAAFVVFALGLWRAIGRAPYPAG